MTAGAAIRSAILRTDGSVVPEVFASSDQIAIEMADLANEVAADIAKSADWRDLTKIATFPGGAASQPKPADYDRMAFGADVAGPVYLWGYQPFASVDDWMAAQSGVVSMADPGGWIIIGGEFRFWPTPSGTASFPYISTHWARDSDGIPKAQFNADDDEFMLSDRLLTLALIWRWKAQKGLEYGEDMATYETALAQEMGRDKGAYAITDPHPRLPGARRSYSGTVR